MHIRMVVTRMHIRMVVYRYINMQVNCTYTYINIDIGSNKYTQVDRSTSTYLIRALSGCPYVLICSDIVVLVIYQVVYVDVVSTQQSLLQSTIYTCTQLHTAG